VAYQKYSTDAIVLRSLERGEADKLVALYTREFGLVWARGSAVRRESSRMRYALQNYTRSSVSFVRGTRGWRIAGATSHEVVDVGNVSGVAAFARIALLVERLVRGEDQNEYLFMTLTDAHHALMREASERHAVIELVCVARILYALGYLSADALGTALFTHTMYAQSHLTEAETKRETLLSSVNKAIAETHL